MSRQTSAVLVWLFLCVPCFAQTLGTITGEVKDSIGRGGSRRHRDRGEQSDQRHPHDREQRGRPVRLSGAAAGHLHREERARGFKTATRDVELQVQQTVRVNFTLELGTIAETATVAGVSPLVETSNATVGTVIENRRIVELPLNGRNYPPARRAEPERQRRVCRSRSGRRSPGRHARQPAAVDFGAAPRIQQLHAGRRRQHRRQLQHLYLPAVGRRARRIQGADRRLLRRVRAWGEPGERGHEIGHEPVCTARCSNSTATMRWTPDRTPSPPRRPPHRRRRSNGISTATRPAARCGRTTCSSCRISRATGIGSSSRIPISVPSTAMRNGNFSELLATSGPSTRRPASHRDDRRSDAVHRRRHDADVRAVPGQHHSREPHPSHLQAAARVLSGAEQRHRRPRPNNYLVAAGSRDRQIPVHAADGLGAELRLDLDGPLQLRQRERGVAGVEAERHEAEQRGCIRPRSATPGRCRRRSSTNSGSASTTSSTRSDGSWRSSATSSRSWASRASR